VRPVSANAVPDDKLQHPPNRYSNDQIRSSFDKSRFFRPRFNFSPLHEAGKSIPPRSQSHR
jgi:hypothetical protein